MDNFITCWCKKMNPGQPVIYTLIWFFFWRAWIPWLMFILYRQRTFGAEKVPAEGPVLLVGNHQSFVDLLAVGSSMYVRLHNPLARKTLFEVPVFGKVLPTWNALPIDQKNMDKAGLNRVIDFLKDGNCVLIYPEGTRTHDGRVHEMKPGIRLILKKAKPTIVPVATEGAYDIWPRTAKAPKPWGNIAIEFGDPIPYEDYKHFKSNAFLDLLQKRLETMRLNLRTRLRHATNGFFPPVGPADEPSVEVFEDELIQLHELDVTISDEPSSEEDDQLFKSFKERRKDVGLL